MKRFAVVLLFGLFLVTACNVRVNVTQGSGKLITETRTVSNFHGIDLSGFGEVNITQGDTESLTIDTDDNIMPLIETKVENGILHIGFTGGNQTISINPTQGIKYTLGVKTLDSLQVSGAGNIKAPALKSDSLTINTSGAGNLNLTGLETKTVTVTVSGAGNILLAGQTETQTATLSGFGNYDSGNLSSAIANVSLSGAGNATVWAATKLDAKISGAGSVSYYGSPQVTQSISGIGAIKSLGSK